MDTQKPLDGYTEPVRKLIAARLAVRSVSAAGVAEEGTSCSLLLDEVRRDHTLSALAAGQHGCKEIPASLGYRQQSTGHSPAALRR